MQQWCGLGTLEKAGFDPKVGTAFDPLTFYTLKYCRPCPVLEAMERNLGVHFTGIKMQLIYEYWYVSSSKHFGRSNELSARVDRMHSTALHQVPRVLLGSHARSYGYGE